MINNTSNSRVTICKFCLSFNLLAVASLALSKPVDAQVVQSPNTNQPGNVTQVIPPRNIDPSPRKEPELPETPQPPALEELLPESAPKPSEPTLPSDSSQTFRVKKFVVEGSTVFEQEDFDKITEPYLNQELTFAQLLEVRSAITKFYVDRGYVTSGALIPKQEFKDGVFTIQVIEGKLEDIKVTGTQKLKRSYVRNRLAIATKQPFNREKLFEALQLLQLKPFIENISATLSAGTRPGENVLEVEIQEADSFQTALTLDNSRTPTVGTFTRQIEIGDNNLFGYGDTINGSYRNTDGSNAFDFEYQLPINPRNGTISLRYAVSNSDIIEEPFNALDIQSNSRYYEVGFRQPIIEKPGQEFGLGVSLSRQESQARIFEGDGNLPFPVSGADDQGRTKVSAIRFSQDWTSRDTQQVFALRSQFSIGLDWFDSTTNQRPPDSNFYAWRGQVQWVRLLARDTTLLLRGDVQFADRPLVPFEQFGVGGQDSIRGYRQDVLLRDNGVFASAEVRIPIVRFSRDNSLLQIAPFIDFASGWNRGGREENTIDNSDPNTLVSAGLGLRLQLEDYLSARFDWGIPFVSISGDKDTLQENGLYFSIVASPF